MLGAEIFLAVLSTFAVGWGIYELHELIVDDDDSSGSEPIERNLIEGTSAAEALLGTDMADLILGHGGTDTVVGGDGNDHIFGHAGDDFLNGSDGNDLVEGGTGSDFVIGDFGNDILGGGDGDDLMKGNLDNDILLGNDGNDNLSGGSEDDVLIGGDGDDLLDGDDGNDILIGGLLSNETNSSGDIGRDIPAEFFAALAEIAETNPGFLIGKSLDQILLHPIFAGIQHPFGDPEVSEQGIDTLLGGDGNDILALGAGDIGYGESGDDVFTLADNLNGSVAIIEDYVAGQDVIEVTYNLLDGAPTIQVTDDGSDAIVSADGVDLVRVTNAAGTLSASDIRLTAVLLPNIGSLFPII